MNLSYLTLVDGASATPTTPQAYTRLETISDFHDLIFLMTSGYDVAYEPVPGSLSGFGKPMVISVVRRISNIDPGAKPPRTGGKCWHIVVDDTPASIAAACRNLLSGKSTATGITLDLTVMGQGPRSIALEKMFLGFTRCMNQRAGRLLDAGDIADLIEWAAGITSTRVDAQVRYGSYPHWGAFMSRSQVDTARAWTSPPDAENATRTLVCSVKPSVDDLRRVVAIGKPFGLVNASSMKKRAAHAAGLNVDKTLALANASAVPVITYKPSPSLPAPSAITDQAEIVARYGATWENLKALSAELYERTTEPLPCCLQAHWDEQREALHQYAIVVDGVAGDIADLARHALSAGIRAAKAHQRPMPMAVVTTTSKNLGDHIELAKRLIAHAPGGTAIGDHNAIATILRDWDGIVGITVEV